MAKVLTDIIFGSSFYTYYGTFIPPPSASQEVRVRTKETVVEMTGPGWAGWARVNKIW